MTGPNPWSLVQASDYERHMGPKGVDQLGPLGALFQEVVLAAQPDRLMLVGCSTGNGLEHVDPSVTRRIVGVDVNLQHLGIARQRFFHLGPRLELFNADITEFRSPPGTFDLVHAALVLEYLHPEVLVRRVAEWLADRGTFSAVLQLPGGDPHEEPSRAMQLITKAMKLLPPEELTELCEHYGLSLRRQREVPLRYGKRFWHGVYGRNTGAAKP
jgi:predicted TPR repeat methyltransferase